MGSLRWPSLVALAVASRASTSLGSVCHELLNPPSAPEHPSDHEAEQPAEAILTEEARCQAKGVSAPDCAFFHEVLALTRAAKGEGFDAEAFCAHVSEVADCAQLVSGVLTGHTVQDLVEADCLKHGASAALCTELKLSVGSNDRTEDAKGLWQCHKAHEAALAEEAHRAHAEAHAAAEAAVEEAPPVEKEDAPGSHTEHGAMLAAGGAVVLGAAALAGYYRSKPRVVSLDDALMSNEGYSQVLDAYNRAYA